MSYEKQNFKNGQVLTAEHLDHIEEGIKDAIPAPVIAQIGQIISVEAVDENGKPTEWKAIDAQGDWNQNTSSEHDYIKNRTHYTETVDVTVLEETAISENVLLESTYTSEDGDEVTAYMMPLTDEMIGSVADSYDVTLDGTLYENIPSTITDAIDGSAPYKAVTIGDLNDVPFVIRLSVYPSDTTADNKLLSDIWFRSNAHESISIVANNVTVVHQLDEKYIPSTIATKADLALTEPLEITVSFRDDTLLSIRKIEKSTLTEKFKGGKVADVRVQCLSLSSDESGTLSVNTYIAYPICVRHGKFVGEDFSTPDFYFSIFAPGTSCNKIYNINTTTDETGEYFVYDSHTEVALS